jgi:hypothetical protein
MLPKISPPTVDALAVEFCDAMREALTSGQMRQVVERNQAEPDAGVCHSHDFCDANMVLHEVFMRHGMDLSAEDTPAVWGDLWNRTWDLAKARGFRMLKRGDQVQILEGFKDTGDDEFTWIVQGDEEKGRVDIVPIDSPMELKPAYVVQVAWVRLVEPSPGSRA